MNRYKKIEVGAFKAVRAYLEQLSNIYRSDKMALEAKGADSSTPEEQDRYIFDCHQIRDIDELIEYIDGNK